MYRCYFWIINGWLSQNGWWSPTGVHRGRSRVICTRDSQWDICTDVFSWSNIHNLQLWIYFVGGPFNGFPRDDSVYDQAYVMVGSLYLPQEPHVKSLSSMKLLALQGVFKTLKHQSSSTALDTHQGLIHDRWRFDVSWAARTQFLRFNVAEPQQWLFTERCLDQFVDGKTNYVLLCVGWCLKATPATWMFTKIGIILSRTKTDSLVFELAVAVPK